MPSDDSGYDGLFTIGGAWVVLPPAKLSSGAVGLMVFTTDFAANEYRDKSSGTEEPIHVTSRAEFEAAVARAKALGITHLVLDYGQPGSRRYAIP